MYSVLLHILSTSCVLLLSIMYSEQCDYRLPAILSPSTCKLHCRPTTCSASPYDSHNKRVTLATSAWLSRVTHKTPSCVEVHDTARHDEGQSKRSGLETHTHTPDNAQPFNGRAIIEFQITTYEGGKEGRAE